MNDIFEPVAAPEAVTPAKPHRRHRWLVAGSAAFAGLLIVAAAWPSDGNRPDAAVASDVQTQQGDGWGSGDTTDDLWSQFNAWLDELGVQGYGDGQQGYGDDQQGTVTASRTMATQPHPVQPLRQTQPSPPGVVIINTQLGYDSGEAAGTGMILTSNGLVLTNNHVINGSTQIKVTDPTSGQTYTAKLLGTDATHDVALLQLQNANGLRTVAIDQDDNEAVGDAVTAVGNASGGGVLMAADGTITGLDASVTTSTNAYEQGETLTGTIRISADVVAGDSGGALLDRDGEVIGMNTAASSGTAGSGETTAYAITIEDALAIVDQIRSGDESGTVMLGYPAFLGVGLSQDGGDSATLGNVYDGTPAAAAGLEPGDTITAVNGKAVSTGTQLSKDLKSHNPGDTVKITWTDANGSSHTAKVTLAEGPAA